MKRIKPETEAKFLAVAKQPMKDVSSWIFRTLGCALRRSFAFGLRTSTGISV